MNRLITRKNNEAFCWFLSTSIVLAFLLSDWSINYFSFGDLIILPSFVFVIVTQWYDGLKKYKGIFFVLVSVLVVNILVNQYTNSTFQLKSSIIASVKVLYFSLFFLFSEVHLSKANFKNNFLKVLNISACITVIIGVLVNFGLSRGHSWPVEYLWKFARTDYQSYYFRGPDSLLRMRSLFNEPAHLGYFLNIIVALNIFSIVKNKMKIVVVSFLSLGILLTFSYSSIGILLVQSIVFFILNYRKKIKYDFKTIMLSASMILIIFIFRQIAYETLVIRTIDIIKGEDLSFFNRIIGSWGSVSINNILFGQGIANSPVLFNIYAYILSDLGIITFLIYLSGNILLIKKNVGLGFVFVLLNFQRGGYIGIHYWILLFLCFYFVDANKKMIKTNFSKNNVRHV